MRTQNVNKIVVGFFACLLLTAVAAASYLQQPLLAFVPLLLLLVLLLVQHPHYLLYLLIASIPWSFEYKFSTSLGTDLPDEPMMLLTAFAALMLWVHGRKHKTWQRLHPLVFLLLLQPAWTVITVILSTHSLVSIKYLLAKSWYLLAFVTAPTLLFKEERRIKHSAIILAASMLLFMIAALLRQAQYNWSFEKVNEALTPSFSNHVTYSALLVCIVPLLIAFVKSTPQKSLRYFLISLFVITILALYLSYSRGAWLALTAGLISYWLLKRKRLAISFLLFFVLCIAGILWLKKDDRYLQFASDYKTTIFHTNFREHLLATYEMKDVSTAERYYRWIAGVRMVKDSWKTGFGPNTFYDNYKSYTIPAFKTWVSNNEEHSTVHNYFLLLLIEQGAIGLVLFLLLLGALFWYAQTIYHRTNDAFWKTTVAAVAAIVTMVGTVNFLSDLIETDKVGSVFYLCVAVLIIADGKTRISSTNDTNERVPE